MIFVGVDGGGTHTRVCVMDEHQHIIGTGKSGPSSIDTVPIEVTIKHIEEALSHVLNESNTVDQNIQSIFLGLGGILTEVSKKHVRDHLKQLPYFNETSIIQVENDVYSALLGGLTTRSGIALISGTGSVAFGVNEEGQTHRAGGYGYQEGDFGSSYHLGKLAMMHVTRAFDNRLPVSAFSEALFQQLKINNLNDMMDTIMTYHDDRTKIASLAPIVTKHANLGNIHAREMCLLAVEELTLCVKAVYHNIHLHNKEIAIIGSLGNSEGYFKELLHEAILAIDETFNIHEPLIEPVVGSVYKAYQNAGYTLKLK